MSQTVNISPDGFEMTFKDLDDVERWFERERSIWQWLLKSKYDPNHLRSDVNGHVGAVKAALVAQRQSNIFNPQQICNPFAQGQLLASETADGKTVLAIHKQEGEVAGLYSYGFHRGVIPLDGVKNKQAIRGFFLSAFPSLISPTDLDDRLKKERANYRSSLKGAMAQTDEFMDERRARWENDVGRAKKTALRYLRKLNASNNALQGRFSGEASAAISEIRETDNTFREFMGLKAPVDYWRNKAKEHDKAQKSARTTLERYLGGLIVGLFLVFLGSGLLVKVIHKIDGNDPIALYVLISGAVAVVSSLGIWMARILTKLYLSQVHLKTDAEERAIMTETYLALIESGHATEDEKNIILTALFRTSADGIVADDGPPSIGLQSLLAKQLSK